MTETKTQHRILIISHGHPSLRKGGAEVAAYNHFKELTKRGDCRVVFLAAADGPGRGTTPFSVINTDSEILFHSNIGDQFTFRQSNPVFIWRDFRLFLQNYRPTIIHFHHYMNVGLDMVREARNTLPQAAIIMTLYEYLAICPNNGQMVKRRDGRLCYRSSPIECHRCMGERLPGDYFMREKYIKSFFALVDCFICNSHFLMERYEQWGLPSSKLIFIENGQTPPSDFARRTSESHLNLGYFGQITQYKGVDILLRALQLLPKNVRKNVHLDIHGGNLEFQTETFRETIQSLLDDNKDIATAHGLYEPHEIGRLMADIDWVIVPSIWWENSPLVIQEAFKYRRPIICSDIGGMAEKVADGVNGIHFQVRNPSSLANVIQKVVRDPTLWQQLVDGIPEPLSIESFVDMQWDVYERVSHQNNTNGIGVTQKVQSSNRGNNERDTLGRNVKALAVDSLSRNCGLFSSKQSIMTSRLNRRPIFVVGSMRTGSSTMVKSLRECGIIGHNEGHFLALFATLTRIVPEYIASHQDVAFPRHMLTDVDQEDFLSDLYDFFDGWVASMYQSGHWMEKTVNIEGLLAVPIFSKIWPKARFIFMKRRGMENVCSRLRKSPESSFEFHCQDWSDIMSAWLEIRKDLGGKYLEVEQFDMLIDPDRIAVLVSEFLDLSDAQAKLLGVSLQNIEMEKTGSDSTVLALQDLGWSDAQQAQFRQICGKAMEMFGYGYGKEYWVK